MSEEKKKERKMKYEQPRLVKISGIKSRGYCWSGSGDGQQCMIGNAADNSCAQGNGVIPPD